MPKQSQLESLFQHQKRLRQENQLQPKRSPVLQLLNPTSQHLRGHTRNPVEESQNYPAQEGEDRMGEVEYPVRVDYKIVYKKGLEREGLLYLKKKIRTEKYALLSLLFGFFLFILMDNNGVGGFFIRLIVLLSPWSLNFILYLHYETKFRRCVEDIIKTTVYQTGNTNRRGWWK